MTNRYYIPDNDDKSAANFLQQLKNAGHTALDNNRHLVVAFLAYDLHNPEIMEILQDDKYFSAIDRSTNDDIALFCLAPSIFNKDIREIKKRSKSIFHSGKKIKSLFTLKPNNNYTDSLFNNMLSCLGYHKYNGICEPPFILFMKINKDGEVEDNFLASLKYEIGETKDAYREIMKVIERVTNALCHVHRDDDMNQDTIFNLVKSGAKITVWDRIKGEIGKTTKNNFWDILGISLGS
jgi:hypothetical protein